MPLRIIPATDPIEVKNIVMTIYSAPGLGKSTLSFTADKPLLLDFDKGAYRAANRGAIVPVSSWKDVQGMTPDDLADYNTIIVDTAGRALESLSLDIADTNPKASRADGSLTLQGFGTLKVRFAQWQAFLRSLGKDLILICHMDEQKNGDDTMERIDAQGSSKNEIYKSSDAMGRIVLDGKDKAWLDFDPHQGGFGKNPARLPKTLIPRVDKDPQFLAGVITQIKTSINRTTANQAEVVKKANEEQALWTKLFAESPDLASFNNAPLGLAKERQKTPYASAVKAEAKKRGYVFNKTSGLFEQPAVVA